jgi:hypothetical protein
VNVWYLPIFPILAIPKAIASQSAGWFFPLFYRIKYTLFSVLLRFLLCENFGYGAVGLLYMD